MLTVKEVLTDKVTLDVEGIDRVYLNGYVKQLQLPGGLIPFIREQMGFPIPSPMVLPPFTQVFRKAVEQYAQAQGLAITDFAKGEDQDEKARAHLAKFEKKQGVVLIGQAQEEALGYKAQKSMKGTRVWFEYSRQSLNVTDYYFYILAEEFGLFFIKVCTYFPFDRLKPAASQAVLNGRGSGGFLGGFSPPKANNRARMLRWAGNRRAVARQGRTLTGRVLPVAMPKSCVA